MIEEVFAILPRSWREEISGVAKNGEIQEIRLRAGRRLEILVDHSPSFLSCIVKREEVEQVVATASHYSLYRFQDDIRKGFLTIRGGHRIGISGEAVTEKEEITTIEPISFLNIRVAREREMGEKRWAPLLLEEGRVKHTVIAGPPYSGKTTALRQLVKWLSDHPPTGCKVALIDERSELAACFQGVPQLDIGNRTDVLDRCPKREGIALMIRSMSPEVIAVDEVDGQKDMKTLEEAVHAGVSIVSTVHADDWVGLKHRLGPLYSYMERVIFLERLGKRTHTLSLYKDRLGTPEVMDV